MHPFRALREENPERFEEGEEHHPHRLEQSTHEWELEIQQANDVASRDSGVGESSKSEEWIASSEAEKSDCQISQVCYNAVCHSAMYPGLHESRSVMLSCVAVFSKLMYSYHKPYQLFLEWRLIMLSTGSLIKCYD